VKHYAKLKPLSLKGGTMTIKRKLTAGLLAASVAFAVNANPLEQELAHLVKTHPLLLASDFAIDASVDNTAAVNANFYTRLKLNAETGREKIASRSYLPDDNFYLGNAGTGPNQRSKLSYRKWGLTLETPLWHGGRNYSDLRTAQLNQDMAAMDKNGLTQQVLLEGITAYLQVARFLTLIKLTEENEASTLNQLELERKRVDAGGGVAVDALQAQTRLQIVRERTVFYRQGLRDVMTNYQQVFGRLPDLNNLQSLDLFAEQLPQSVDVALNIAKAQSPDIQAADIETKRANEALTRVKTEYTPRFDLVVGSTHEFDKNMLDERSDMFVGVKMNWEYSLGFETKYRSSEATNRLNEQKQRAKNVNNRTAEAVNIAWNQVENGQERLSLLTDAAEISKTVMEDRKRLRDAGKETALSVLDAEVEYYGVLASRVNALYDTRISSYRLMNAMGKLTPDTIGIDGQFKLPVQSLSLDLMK